MRTKRGTLSPDGRLYWGKRAGSEVWLSPTIFHSYALKERARVVKWQTKNREVYLSRSRSWRESNPERYRARLRDWYSKNKEKVFADSKEWARNNPAKRLDSRRKWLSNNPEKMARARAQWRKENPERQSHYSGLRRGYLAKSVSDLTHEDSLIICEYYASSRRVSNCLGIPHHVDHIIPLSKGGLHEPSNLQILPAKINLRKSNKLDFYYPETVAA